MIQRHTKVDVEVILSVSIPVLAVCTGASSLFTSTLFTTQNIASAALYCTFIAMVAPQLRIRYTLPVPHSFGTYPDS